MFFAGFIWPPKFPVLAASRRRALTSWGRLGFHAQLLCQPAWLCPWCGGGSLAGGVQGGMQVLCGCTGVGGVLRNPQAKPFHKAALGPPSCALLVNGRPFAQVQIRYVLLKKHAQHSS